MSAEYSIGINQHLFDRINIKLPKKYRINPNNMLCYHNDDSCIIYDYNNNLLYVYMDSDTLIDQIFEEEFNKYN